jgi:hypothetical protein
MTFKCEPPRIEIDSNVSAIERILTGALGTYLIFTMLINPHGFWHSAFSDKELPFAVKIPGLLAGVLFSLGAIYLLYRSVTTPKKEKIEWKNGELKIQFGTYSFKKRGTNPDLDLFKKSYEFNKAEFDTLKLVTFSGGNEITIDRGKKRIRIGTCLTESEREDLFQKIKSGMSSE